MSVERNHLKRVAEAALLASDQPLKPAAIAALFDESEHPEASEVREVLRELAEDYEGRGVELVETASGFRFQVPAELASWVTRLWAERAPRYSRVMLETLATGWGCSTL